MTTQPDNLDLDLIEQRAAHLYEYVDLPDDAEILAGTEVPALIAETRRLRDRVAELERPAIELKRNEIRLSYRQLAVQAREDRDYEGEATVLKQLADHEEQWKREDSAATPA